MSIPLNEWIAGESVFHMSADKITAMRSMYFVKDQLMNILRRRNLEYNLNVVKVHILKGVSMPVYEVTTTYGLTRIVFYYTGSNWIVSVNTLVDIEMLEKVLPFFDASPSINIATGLDETDIYGSYIDNKNTFTISVDSEYDLYLLFNEVMTQLVSVVDAPLEEPIE